MHPSELLYPLGENEVIAVVDQKRSEVQHVKGLFVDLPVVQEYYSLILLTDGCELTVQVFRLQEIVQFDQLLGCCCAQRSLKHDNPVEIEDIRPSTLPEI
jgi:hypothetical protein